jgi:hypothetical protein
MATMKHSRHKRIANGILRLLCFLVALSFTAPLFPIVSASSGSNTMPCCKGKAGHCDSGIAPKQVLPPTSEPMCGLKEVTMDDDGITIVAQPSETESHHQHSHSQTAETDGSQPAAESASLSQPCRMDCGACLASSSRTQKRERVLAQAIALPLSSPTTVDRFNYLSLPLSSNVDWKQTSPRGPPSDLL